METFTVQVLKKRRWMVAGHGGAPFEAVTLAKGFINRPGIAAVKVTTKKLDQAQGVFRDETIYAYPKNLAELELLGGGATGQDAHDRFFVRNSSTWLVIAALVVGIFGNLGLAVMFGVGMPVQLGNFMANLGPNWGTPRLVLYDLPTMVLDFETAGRSQTLSVRISLQVNDSESLRQLGPRRIQIVEKAVELLGRARPEVFETTDGMNQLRRWVHDGVQSAAGDVQIRNVLFRKINFM
jgi:flagellar basal body-associated protein FliL